MKNLLVLLFSVLFVSKLLGQVPFPIVFGPSPVLDFSDTNSSKYILIDSLIGTNVFQIGSPQKSILNSPYSTPNAIITDTINFYPINNHSTFYMTLLKDEGLMDFMFYTQYDTDLNIDGGNIQISLDGGATWGNVIDSTFLSIYNMQVGYGTNFYTKFDTVQSLNWQPGFSGSSNGWIYSSFGIYYQNAIQNTDTFLLKFEFASDSIDNNKDGWAIDDISISANHVGISKVNQDELLVFPNPSRGLFTIKGLENKYSEISIYNLMGLKIWSRYEFSDSIIDLSEYESGLYLVVISNENGSIKGTISIER